MKHLFPALSSAKANVAELERLREAQMQLQMQGIHRGGVGGELSAADGEDGAEGRDGAEEELCAAGICGRRLRRWRARRRSLRRSLRVKAAATPSLAWKLLMTRPSRSRCCGWRIRRRTRRSRRSSRAFYTEWPQAKQKIPYMLMQEMRIVPELPSYR